jgi:opacity protein-like surface antigen
MRVVATLLAALTLLTVGATPAFAVDMVDAATLQEIPQAFSGKQIQITGELIGDYGFRDDGTVWTQLNDDPYATKPLRDGGRLSGSNIGIGVHGDAGLFENLDPPGRYDRAGPLVTVTGTWRFHDPNRSGETYLEIQTLTVDRAGVPLSQSMSTTTLIVGVLFLFAAAGVLVSARSRLG